MSKFSTISDGVTKKIGISFALVKARLILGGYLFSIFFVFLIGAKRTL